MLVRQGNVGQLRLPLVHLVDQGSPVDSHVLRPAQLEGCRPVRSEDVGAGGSVGLVLVMPGHSLVPAELLGQLHLTTELLSGTAVVKITEKENSNGNGKSKRLTLMVNGEQEQQC